MRYVSLLFVKLEIVLDGRPGIDILSRAALEDN